MTLANRPKRPVYAHNRKAFTVRLYDREREKGKAAAARMNGCPKPGSSPWSHAELWAEADYWRGVGLDWAGHLEGLPHGAPAELPSAKVKRLEQRIAQLEAENAKLKRDASRGAQLPAPLGVPPAHVPVEHRGAMTVHRSRERKTSSG